MSGEIAGQVGYGLGQEERYLSPSEAMGQVAKALEEVQTVRTSCAVSGNPEVFAFRTHVLAEKASALAQACYVLQRAAYEAARPDAEKLPSDPMQAE